MNSIPENTPTSRKCSICLNIKPLNADGFYKDNKRQYGYSYNCKVCESKRGLIKRLKNPRKDAYKNMTQEQKDNKSKWAREYFCTPKGRAITLISSYRKIDKKRQLKCDLTAEFMINKIFNVPCYYCGDLESTKGCDRISNLIGHTMDNVVSSCRHCNVLRGDSYTVAEMKIIGEAIKRVKKARRNKMKIAQ